MKQEQLRACQPLQFERFVHILEQGSLITPISFQVILEV